MAKRWNGSGGGARWALELDDDRLLPGRLAACRLTLTAERDIEARALVLTLRGEERYRHVVSDGKTTTIVTERDALPSVPVIVAQPVRLAAGETCTWVAQLPVPALGPASLDATEAAIEWTLEAKLDLDYAFDSGIEVPVRVVQPVALLRAGIVHVGEFGMYDAAEAAAGGVSGTIRLDPVPLVAGEPFAGLLTLHVATPTEVTEVRLEVRVTARCTMSGGQSETLVPFAAVVAGPGRILGTVVLEVAGTLEDRALPSIERKHLRADAEVHVILARRMARDPHLVRDIAIATTSAL